MLRIVGLLYLMSLTLACTRHINEDDVFLPWMAEGTTFTITVEDDVLFTRNQPRAGLFDELGVVFEEGTFSSDVGEIAYRHMRVEGDNVPLIVYCGGNAYDLPNHGALSAYKLAPHGDALLWDYPGYGDSAGAPTTENFRKALAALPRQIDQLRRSENQPVIFWGHSLGGFVCAELAAQSPHADAVVFEASAPSAAAASKYFAPRFIRPFVRVKLSPAIAGFDSVAALEEKPVPALVLAGRHDRILPPQLSEELRDELGKNGRVVSYYEFPDANHFHIGFQEDYDEIVSAFLRGVEHVQRKEN